MCEMFKEGNYISCSSCSTESSYQQGTNGFFTTHLLKGLRGEYQREISGCSQCATRVTNLRQVPIQKVTSPDLTTYLAHAVSGTQNFAWISCTETTLKDSWTLTFDATMTLSTRLPLKYLLVFEIGQNSCINTIDSEFYWSIKSFFDRFGWYFLRLLQPEVMDPIVRAVFATDVCPQNE